MSQTDTLMPKITPMSTFGENIFRMKYSLDGKEDWADTARRVVTSVIEPYFPELVEEMVEAVVNFEFMPGGRYLYAAGKRFKQVNNCFLFRAEDSREGLASLMQRVANVLMTGGGAGVVWSDLRPNGAPVAGMGGTSTGPIAFMQVINEIGRGIVQGGGRRAAMWAGLHWNHPDIMDFITLKNWAPEIIAMKEKDFNAVAPMDMTNISVILDDDFFAAYDRGDVKATTLYKTVVEQMLLTGEPGFSVDVGENSGENLRNPCSEIVSRDDNDICCLGSINLARVDSLDRFERLVELGTIFLLCGTLYSDVPFPEVADTRAKNRRLGLGLMGIYEWLMLRGYGYEPNDELREWLHQYANISEQTAEHYADKLYISRPVKVRAIAPTGTIGILAGTTTGIEPLFAAAMKRRFLREGKWHYQYVIDATAERMIERGVDPANLETAYDMANDPEKRVAFQAWVQEYVDQGISSTLNLPAPSEQKFSAHEFGEMLIKYLPKVRGITVYPDGARGGQPLNVVPLEKAQGYTSYVYEEFGNEKGCLSGSCGI